jgi:hypothetical protein
MIGAGNVPMARLFYSTFKTVSAFAIVVVMVLQYNFRAQMVNAYTNDEGVRE